MIKKNFAALTGIEKAALAARKKVLVTFFKTYPAALVLSMLLSLFAIFVTTDDFLARFTPEMATATSGLFTLNAFMLGVLFFATYAKSEPGGTAARDYLLCIAMVTVTYIVAVSTCARLNVYVLPLSLCALVLSEVSNRRNAVSVTLITGRTQKQASFAVLVHPERVGGVPRRGAVHSALQPRHGHPRHLPLV